MKPTLVFTPTAHLAAAQPAQPPRPGMRVVHAEIDARIDPQSLRVQQALLRLLTPAWQQMREQQQAAADAARVGLADAATPNPGPAT